MGRREQWEFKPPWLPRGDDGELTVTVHDDGSVLLEIEDEHAVDSYNEEFLNSTLLPREKVAELHALLGRALKEG